MMRGGPGSQHREGDWLRGPTEGQAPVSGVKHSRVGRCGEHAGSGGLEHHCLLPGVEAGSAFRPWWVLRGRGGKSGCLQGGQTWQGKCVCARECAHVHPQA